MTETIQTKTSAVKIYSAELKKEIPWPTDDDALLNEEQAAAFIGVTRRAMQAWRISGKGPLYIRISSRCIRYKKPHLIEWGEAHIQMSTSQDKQGVET